MGTATTYSTARSVASCGTSCVLSDCVHNLSGGERAEGVCTAGIQAAVTRGHTGALADLALACHFNQNTVHSTALSLPDSHMRGEKHQEQFFSPTCTPTNWQLDPSTGSINPSMRS